MFKLIVIILLVSMINQVHLSKDGYVTIKSGPMRGAMVDQYDRQVLIIRLKSPSDVLKDSISKMDKQRMRSQDYQEILRVLGNIEVHFQKQFKDALAFQSELIASPYPVRDDSGNGRIIDISGLHRQKRQIWRALFSFLRLARPAARVAGKLTKYGRFLKVVKYGGYAASAAVFAYELADIFGAIPDHKYSEITQQLALMHENRIEDLKVMKNITLLSVNSQNAIKDLTIEVDNALGQAKDRTELSILISQIFSSYLQQLTTGLILLMNGKIPSFFLSLETQILWLETKLPGVLLNEISSITPHLSVTLKGVDSENNQLIILVEVPKLTSSFQILHFVEWEPEVVSNRTCYTSPRKRLLLAFPPGLETSEIKNPLLIDPDSCQTEGYIMCESDSILDHIPGLSQNRLCTKLKSMRVKREIENLFEAANTPTYDVTQILEKTLESNHIQKKTDNHFNLLEQRIDFLIKEAEEQRIKAVELMKKASADDRLVKILFFLIIPILGIIVMCLGILIYKKFKQLKHKRDTSRRDNLMKTLKQLQQKHQEV